MKGLVDLIKYRDLTIEENDAQLYIFQTVTLSESVKHARVVGRRSTSTSNGKYQTKCFRPGPLS